MRLGLFALFISTPFWATSLAYGAESYQILSLGDWHGEEVAAKNGETWLGLFRSAGRAELISGKLEIELMHDIVMDNRPEEKTGKKVRFSTGEKTYSAGADGAPVVLLRGKGITTGLASWLTGEVGQKLYLGQGLYLDDEHSVTATGVAIDGQYPNPVDQRDYCVKLVKKRKNSGFNETRKLFCLDRINEDAGVAEVLFVGDIDRDGYPDVILGGSDHYNVSAIHLYLSSTQKGTAEEGWPKKVAEFRTTGC